MKYLIALVYFLWASVAQGDPVIIRPIPPGDDVITVLRKGQIAPHDGQLFDMDTSIRWALYIQQYQELLGAERERAQSACNNEVTYQTALRNVEATRAQKLEADLLERLKRSETGRLAAENRLNSPPWYDTGIFKFSLGVLTASTVIFTVQKMAD